MNKIRTLILQIFVFLILINAVLPLKADAYVDPGTGSMVLQIIVASIIGLTISIKAFWANIKMSFCSLLGKKVNKKDSEDIHNKENENITIVK